MKVTYPTQNDIEKIKSWWDAAEMRGFHEGFIPHDHAYVVYDNTDNARALLCLYTTNISEYAYLECFVSDPTLETAHRREVTEFLVEYVENKAKQLGYRKLICLTHIDPLKPRYEALGYQRSLNNVTTFVKEL